MCVCVCVCVCVCHHKLATQLTYAPVSAFLRLRLCFLFLFSSPASTRPSGRASAVGNTPNARCSSISGRVSDEEAIV